VLARSRPEHARIGLQQAAAIRNELEKETLLELAQCYRDLAQMKRLVLRKVN